jgi:hypothetical protein
MAIQPTPPGAPVFLVRTRVAAVAADHASPNGGDRDALGRVDLQADRHVPRHLVAHRAVAHDGRGSDAFLAIARQSNA